VEDAPPPPPTEAPSLPRPRAATFLLALVGLFPVGLAAQALTPAAGLVWTELFGFALPAAALVAILGLDPRPFLGLTRPPPGALRLALAVGLLAILAGGALQALWASVLPDEVLETFDVTRLFHRPPWEQRLLVFGATVLAPCCEELAFRGHLLSALRLRWSPGAAVGLSALAFALLHLDPVRLPGLLFLGTLYGWMAWRAGSVWPGVLAHAVNNGTATALALAWPDSSLASGPAPEPAAAAAVLLFSLALLAPLLLAYQRTTPTPPRPDQALSALSASPARAGRLPRWVPAGTLAAAGSLLLIALLARR
jgi:hypothetical protein